MIYKGTLSPATDRRTDSQEKVLWRPEEDPRDGPTDRRTDSQEKVLRRRRQEEEPGGGGGGEPGARIPETDGRTDG